jgi:hypothetical protein
MNLNIPSFLEPGESSRQRLITCIAKWKFEALIMAVGYPSEG